MQKRPFDDNSSWPALHDLPVLERAHGDAPLQLLGQRMLIAASARAGVAAVVCHPRRLLFDMSTGAAEEIRRTPAELTRTVQIGDAPVVEHITASATEPRAAWCWRAPTAVDAIFAWKLDIGPADRISTDADTDRSALRIAYANGEAAAVFAFSEPVDWTVEPDTPQTLRVTARLQLPAARDVWLSLAVGAAGDGRARDTRLLPDPARLVNGRVAGFRKRARELMRVTAADQRIGRTVECLVDRIESSLIELPQGLAPLSGTTDATGASRLTAVDACTIATAAAAMGATGLPRATLRFLHAVRTSNGLVPATCSSAGACSDASDSATAAWLSLAAQYHAWSADDLLLRELWPDLARAARAVDGTRFGDALRALALTAESLGDAASASDFRRAAGTAAAGLQGVRSVVRTPMHANVRAAQRLLKLVARVFGLEPDAPRGRLRARLAPPTRWQSLRIDNIRLGDARIRLDLQQNPGHTRIVATPTAGAIPIRLILEPVLHRVPTRIAIDERDAQLDLQPLRHRIVAPVQLELDHPRTLDLEFN